MRRITGPGSIVLLMVAMMMFLQQLHAQQDTTKAVDSTSLKALEAYEARMRQIELQRLTDSIKRQDLEDRLKSLRATDQYERERLQKALDTLRNKEAERFRQKKEKIDSLKGVLKGYPVIGLMHDTLFKVYNRVGALSAPERAQHIADMIRLVYEKESKKDTVGIVAFDNAYDIVAGDQVIMVVTENDALWYDTNGESLSRKVASIIANDIDTARREYSMMRQLKKAALVLLAILATWLIIWLTRKFFIWLARRLTRTENEWLRDRKYKNYTILSKRQQVKFLHSVLTIIRILLVILILYISLPIIFSIFPFTRGWAEILFGFIWSPVKNMAMAIWNYLPNIFYIAVILFVMYHVNRGVKYIFKELQYEKIHLPGFYPDWSMPTYSIIRVLLMAFTLVLIFPKLPGSDSEIFKGVSVFIGILFSLGSSSAIANMIAGLVITYMRPFKVGDRVQIAGITGDVLEKTLLVTRLKTTKNEEITIPNSSILSNSTTNYSTLATSEGLIVHTAVTIGYDIPWRQMHEALQEAASRCAMLEKKPAPFVLQTSLDDFYVSYQLNAYTKMANRQAGIYSELHQHIQDVCAERNIEIMSPHYRANRDGTAITIPRASPSGDTPPAQ